MYETMTYDELCECVAHREPEAVKEMQERLERHLSHLVRQLLRVPKAREPLEWRILAELDQLPRLARNALPHEVKGVVCCVARRIAGNLVAAVQRTADTRPAYETLCA